MRKVSLEQFEEWVETGLLTKSDVSAKARRSFFALETRQSNDLLREAQEGLPLENIQTILRIYIDLDMVIGEVDFKRLGFYLQ